MHTEAYQFVREFARGKKFESVLEFGSRNINGSVRNLFDTQYYHGIDLYPGPDVDEVADATEYVSPQPVQCVVCCELLEHTPKLEGIVHSAAVNLRLGGYFIVTCATPPRKMHSAHDGRPLQIEDEEYYANIDPLTLLDVCRQYQLTPKVTRVARDRGDLYVIAQRQ